MSEEAVMSAKNRIQSEPVSRAGVIRGGLLLAASLTALVCVLAVVPAALAQDANVTTQHVTTITTVATQPSVGDPAAWIGRNISAVVDTFGQPSYWNASHDGGGGGGRYIFDKPNQPHFVFETQPGGMIVRAARIH
jgi:hypothetical protein